MSAQALLVRSESDVADSIWQLSGRLDDISVPPLLKQNQALFEQDSGTAVRLDLSQVNHVNSAGLALLIDWLRSARKEKLELKFENPSEQLVSLARFGGVAEMLGFSA